MNILIIIVCLLAILGSILWLKPSAADTRKARWRQEASQQQIEIALHTFTPDAQKTGIYQPLTGMRYLWRRPQGEIALEHSPLTSWAVTRQPGWYNQELPEGWYWLDPVPENNLFSHQLARQVQAAITQLPLPATSVEILTATASEVSILWQEQGTDFDAVQLKKYLSSL